MPNAWVPGCFPATDVELGSLTNQELNVLQHFYNQNWPAPIASRREALRAFITDIQ